MPIALNQHPDDIDALKSLVADQAFRNEQLQSKVILLQEQLNLALAKRYAASSEKISPDQVCMFDEAKVDALAIEDTDNDVILVPAHTRQMNCVSGWTGHYRKCRRPAPQVRR